MSNKFLTKLKENNNINNTSNRALQLETYAIEK